jgi:hypothetical protein
MRELVGDGGNDTAPLSRFFKLSRAQKVATQHDALIWPVLPSFSKRLLWYTLRNSGFSGASLAGQLEDTVRRGFDSSFGNFVHYLDACSGHAFFMLELFEIGSMVSLLGGSNLFGAAFCSIDQCR